MAVYWMQLEDCSLMASTPDGAYELRLEEMQSKTAPLRQTHNSLIFVAVEKEKSSNVFFPEKQLWQCSLENVYKKKQHKQWHDIFDREQGIVSCESLNPIKAKWHIPAFANAPFCLWDGARFGHFSPAHCKLSPLLTATKSLVSFRPDDKASPKRGQSLSFYSSLPEWHFAHRGSFAAEFGPNPPGSLDNFISSWWCGEQMSGNAASWC